jgi:hypothetical protein
MVADATQNAPTIKGLTDAVDNRGVRVHDCGITLNDLCDVIF